MNAAVEQIQTPENGLIPVENINAISIFTEGGLKDLLERIETEAVSHVPDVSTDKGRKEIASIAYKVARSKTTIDDAGKQLVSGWKKQASEVDATRRHAREFLDGLRDKVRQPLTEWEEEQARIVEEKRRAEEAEKARIEAERLAELEARERKVREAEEAQERARLEHERKEREAAEEAARVEREQRLKEEAEERGRQQAAAALERERIARETAEKAAKAAEAKAEAERQAIIEAERQKAAREAEEREARRLAEEEEKRKQAAARAADRENRAKVNAAIVDAFASEGIDEEISARVIQLVASGAIPAMSIRY